MLIMQSHWSETNLALYLKLQKIDTYKIRLKDNLTKNEKITLKQLKSDNAIIIKEADKGNDVVIMDRDFSECSF